MKSSLFLTPFIFCLFSVFWNSPLHADEKISIELERFSEHLADENENYDSPPLCIPPAWLSTTNITHNSATFNWSSASGALNYSIQWRYAGGTWYDLGGGPWTGTWVNVGGLQSATAYEWRIRSNCSYGEYSAWSPGSSFTTLGALCHTPGWPTTSNITSYSATFSWSPVSGATSYSVQTRLPGGTWVNAPGSPFTTTTVTVGGFTAGTTYEWRVQANCGYNQQSYWTSPISFTTTGGSSCHAPSWLSTTDITQTTAVFNWSSVNNAVSYSIQWRVAGGIWYDLPGGPWSNTWVYIGGLQPATTYEWRVRSNCSNGSHSAYSYGSSFTTQGSACGIPTWPTTSNITQHSATFSWSPVSGASSYSVQTRLPNGTWYDAPGSPTSYTSLTVGGFSPGTSYQWRVRANCGYGQYSYWTSPIYFTTLGGQSCTTPYWLYTSNITQSSATFNWSSVSGASSYSIQYRTPGGNWYDVGGYVTGTWYTLSGLYPGTTYEWRIRSNCGYSYYSAWSYPISFTTLGSTCHTPGWPSTSHVTQTTATFNWSAVYGAHGYEVQIRTLYGNWVNVYGSPVTGTWITATGLYPNTTYQWRVRTKCGYGVFSYWTTPINFTTTGESACPTPYWLHTSNITQTSATLNWSSASYASSYSIQWRQAGGTWYDVGYSVVGTWYTLHGLYPGTAYEWRVRSNCYYGSHSAWSYISSFTTLGGVHCQTPGWPNTYNITQTTATFSWSAVYGASSYTVQIRLYNGIWYDIPNGNVQGTWVTVTGLSPNTAYQWRVRANCGYGQYSYWTSPTYFITPGGPACVAPQGLHTADVSYTSAVLHWSPVAGAENYSVQWRKAGSSVWNDLAGGPWTETTVTMTNLLPGTTYMWRVRSNCGYGYHSSWSGFHSFTTLTPLCDPPVDLSVSDTTETSATLHWSNIPGAIEYLVQIRVVGGSWSNASGSPFTDTTATLNNLNPGTTYEWRVRANCGHPNQSDWSVISSFTTPGMIASLDNDECIEATLLTVNNSCVVTPASNVGATPSVPAPMGWCPTNNYKDVWFKFAMPNVSDPVVTIRTIAGTLTDGVMEVYSGECNNLTLISCEDDNYNGNGNAMPVISVTGSANMAIWVRVWGYAGTTGSFGICVLDYQSNNLVIPEELGIIKDEGDGLDFPDRVETAVEQESEPMSLQVAPNPVSDILYVTLTQTEKSMVNRIVLTDMSGKVMFGKTYQNHDVLRLEEQLDVSALSPGMYVLQVMTTTGILSEKVMIVD